MHKVSAAALTHTQVWRSLFSVPNPLCACHVLAETRLVVRPGLDEWSKLESDQVVVKTLEMANLRVISHVLSQSVALDYFNS